MHMYSKYGLPIWLTEFACGFEATELDEEGQVRELDEEEAEEKHITFSGCGHYASESRFCCVLILRINLAVPETLPGGQVPNVVRFVLTALWYFGSFYALSEVRDGLRGSVLRVSCRAFRLFIRLFCIYLVSGSSAAWLYPGKPIQP